MNILTLIKELKKVQKIYGNIDLQSILKIEVEKKRKSIYINN